MVEDDKYCIDILTQVSAATKPLQSFSLELLDEHPAQLRHEVGVVAGEQDVARTGVGDGVESPLDPEIDDLLVLGSSAGERDRLEAEGQQRLDEGHGQLPRRCVEEEQRSNGWT